MASLNRNVNDRYQLHQPLGQGSFGVVYAATDATAPGSPIAFKILTGQKGNAAITLGEEFRSLANLCHPNVTRVLDFGIDRATGEPFYTMELVSGADFVKALAEAPGPELLELAAQALRALAYIHARNIVHADLKPGNLLVRDKDPNGAVEDRVKLLDFGLMRSSGQPGGGTGGTAFYLAPELTRGAPPTILSDLYAFGALLYHAACGQPPFTGDLEDVIEGHRHRFPRPARALKKSVPDALEAVLQRLLAKEPLDRYGSAAEALETLARFSGQALPLETPQIRAMRLLTAPFVGRQAELGLLRAQLDLLITGRPHAGLVLVSGEAGIGKSRLLREFSHHAQIYGAELFRVTCARTGGGALLPLSEPLSRLLQTAPAPLASAYGDILAPIIRGTEDLGDISRQELMGQLVEFLLERVKTPTMLILDDIQWADELTVELLAHLARRSKESQLLVVGGGRSIGHLRAVALLIDLAALSPDEVQALGRGLSLTGELSPDVSRWLTQASAGIPFYIEEIMRSADEAPAAPDAPDGLPSYLDATLKARFERLSADARAAAIALAAFGRPAALAALAAVVERSARTVENAIQELVQHRLVRSGDEAPGSWALVHELFGEVVARIAGADAMARLQGKIAAYLEILSGEGSDQLLAELAYRHRQAGNRERAKSYALKAALRDARLFNHESARDHFRTALELTDRAPTKERRELEEAAARAAEAAGDAEAAIGHLSQARAIAATTNDMPAALQCLAQMGRIHTARGDMIRAFKALNEGLALSELPLHAREYTFLCRQMAAACMEAGKLEMAESYCEKGLSASTESEAGAGLTYTLGLVLAAKGRRDEALAHWERSSSLAQATGRTGDLMRSLHTRAEEHLIRGEPEAAKALAREGLALALKRRDTPHQCSYRYLLAEIALHEGDLAVAETELSTSQAAAERLGYQALVQGALQVRVQLERARGDYPVALAQLFETYQGHHKGTPLEGPVQAHRERRLGQIYTDLGDFKKAYSYLYRATERARALSEPDLVACCLVSIGVLELSRHRLARAEAALREAFGALDRMKRRVTLTYVHLYLGEINLIRGEAKRASEQAETALRLATGIGARPLEVSARALLARALAVSGSGLDAARDHAVAALTLARSLAQPELVTRAAHALGQIERQRPDGLVAAREAYREAIGSITRVSARLTPEQATLYLAEDQRARLLSEWAGLQEAPAVDATLPRSEELVEAIGGISSCLDHQTLLSRLVDASLSLSGAERGAILAGTGATLLVQVARAGGGVSLPPGSFSPSRTMVEKAISERRSVITNDAVGGDAEPSASVLSLDLKSVLVVPLINGTQLLGILYLDSHSATRTFTELDLKLLSLLAHHAAIAMANAVAYREIETLKSRLQSENLYLREEIEKTMSHDGIVGESPALKRALAAVERVAPTESTVLIRGETGTGKELFARALHAGSQRANAALIKVNLAALPTELIDSELFGHEKGAFTGATARRIGRFELAKGGSIFLDEIGDLSPASQVKLLRVLQEREFERLGGRETIQADCRVIAATNRNLEELIQKGLFREDLFYRLAVFPIHLPPLRDRGEDILQITAHLIRRQGKALGRKITAIDEDTRARLLSYRWPGNVRELGNVVERACILARGPVLTTDTLPEGLGNATAAASSSEPGQTLAQQLDALKVRAVKEALARTQGNQAQAAKLLGLQRSNLNRLIKDLGIRE